MSDRCNTRFVIGLGLVSGTPICALNNAKVHELFGYTPVFIYLAAGSHLTGYYLCALTFESASIVLCSAEQRID